MPSRNGTRQGMKAVDQKPYILFVDDEANVLSAMKRMLRRKRGEWDMDFANSGANALLKMSERAADVVVSDMKMPQMTGAELLNRIRENYPDTVRIVLSGFAEKESVLKTIGPSHQYLAKPCDPDSLINVVDRAFALRSLIDTEAVRAAVERIDTLPVLPSVFMEIMDEIEKDSATAESLAEKVAKDIGLTADLLKLTNSAYFSLPQQAISAVQAIGFLGFETVKAILLLNGVFAQFDQSNGLLKVAEQLQDRSFKVGALAKAIAEKMGLPSDDVAQAQCAGVLAHVGTLLLASATPNDFKKAASLMDEEKQFVTDAEQEVFGASHAEVGAYLLGLWGFNDAIVEAVAFHHTPNLSEVHTPGPLAAVHIAQCLSRNIRQGRSEDMGLDEAFLDRAGLTGRTSGWENVFETVSATWGEA